MNLNEMSKYLLGRGYDPYYIKEAISESQNPNNNNYIYNMMMSNYGESNPKTALYNIYDLEFGNPEGVSRSYPSSKHKILQDYFNKIFNNQYLNNNKFSEQNYNLIKNNPSMANPLGKDWRGEEIQSYINPSTGQLFKYSDDDFDGDLYRLIDWIATTKYK